MSGAFPAVNDAAEPARSVTVRVATTADSVAIGTIHLSAFSTAHRCFLPDTVLASFEASAWIEHWEDRLSLPAGDDHFVLAAVDGSKEVAGFISAGGSRDDDGKGDGEIYALYVAPDRTRHGIGAALVATALERLHDGAFLRATLWVARENRAAQRFATRLGFVDDGATKPVAIEKATLPSLRYGRLLDEPSSSALVTEDVRRAREQPARSGGATCSTS